MISATALPLRRMRAVTVMSSAFQRPPGSEPGTYVVEVLASDTRASNFGRAVAELVVRPSS